MILKLYPFLSTLAAPFVMAAFALWSLITGKKRRGLIHHFGALPRMPRTKNKTVWVHALSLGEINAAHAVLKELHALQPDLRIVVTVTTDSGYDAAQEKIPFASSIGFHPLDCWPFVIMAMHRIRPDVFVLFDTGFWPGLLLALKDKNIPAILLNGRVSRRSKERYSNKRGFFAPLFQSFQLLGMQNQDGAEVMQTLGVTPEKIHVLGDPKLDALIDMSDTDRDELRRSLGLSDQHQVMIAGSTHAGEESILLDAFQMLKQSHPALIMILAPRRMERAQEVAALLQTRNMAYIRRSEEQHAQEGGVLLLDTMGELARCYSIADVAFVGRSLIHPGGGHSLIEPAQFGLPVLTGPFVENQRDQARQLSDAGIAFTVTSARQLADCASQFLTDPTYRAELSDKAKAFMAEHRGISKNMAELLITFIP